MQTSAETVARLAHAKAEVVKRPTRKRKPAWAAPDMSAFAHGTVLALDQTFSKTGYVLFTHRPGLLLVHSKGKIVEPPLPDLKGFADTIQRSVWMAERIHSLIQTTILDGLSGEEPMHRDSLHICHEMPAAHGMRIESSLIGAVAVHLACSRLNLRRPTMVAKQHAAAVLIDPDDRMNGKPAMGRAVNRYFDTKGREWNQDSRDAFAIGLTYLYDLAQERAA